MAWSLTPLGYAHAGSPTRNTLTPPLLLANIPSGTGKWTEYGVWRSGGQGPGQSRAVGLSSAGLAVGTLSSGSSGAQDGTEAEEKGVAGQSV